jgi:hypothetical protein
VDKEQEKGIMKIDRSWTPEERQAFADRNILKAQRVADKRKKNDKKACRNFRWQG